MWCGVSDVCAHSFQCLLALRFLTLAVLTKKGSLIFRSYFFQGLVCEISGSVGVVKENQSVSGVAASVVS
jgi:hypothetical protein